MSKTNVHVVIDRTGSMSSIKQDAIEGFNAFLQKTRGKDQKWWVWQFDSESIDLNHEAADPFEIPFLNDETYRPRAMTPLYDAIGKAVSVAHGARKVKKNLLVILTDGLENASSEYKLEDIRAMTAELEANGWQIIYLAANQDAFEVGQSFGLGTVGTQYVTLSGTGDSYVGGLSYAAAAAVNYVSTGSATYGNVGVSDTGTVEDRDPKDNQ